MLNFREQLKTAEVTPKNYPDFVAHCAEQFMRELIAVICSNEYREDAPLNVKELVFCINGFDICVKKPKHIQHIFIRTAIADVHDVFDYIKEQLKAESFTVKNEHLDSFTVEFN